MRDTIDAIWNKGIPNADFEVDEKAGLFFERYGENFKPLEGRGDIEIWIPIN